MSKNAKLLRALVFMCALGTTIYFALFQRFLPVALPESVRGTGDHHLHMLAFFCLTVIVLFASRSVMWPVLCVVSVATILEGLQIWFPERGANIEDLLASLSGIGLGVVAMMTLRTVMRRVRRQLR